MDQIKQQAVPILKKHGIKKASLFGSWARGENTKKSDVDLLIEPPEEMSLLGLIGIKLDLEEVLHKKVDVGTYDSVHPRLKKYIFQDAKVIYNAGQ